MKLNEMILSEFDNEIASTRKMLERVPEEHFDWKPHEKSMNMQGLATHIANLLTWADITINQDELDMNPPNAPAPKTKVVNSVKELLAMFDKNAADARAAITGADNELLFKPWSLLSGGNTIFTMPRIAVLRSFVMNHIIHHRAQLGVYLRLNDIAVPAIYGPTADESGM